MKKSFVIALLVALQLSCAGQRLQKINGVSFVASRDEARQDHVDPVLQVNANHAAVMPFGFVRSTNAPQVVFNSDRQWFGETTKGAQQYIELLHANGLSVMLKPQLWIWHGEFTGTLKMDTEADWQQLETSYEKFILSYVDIAARLQVDLFCIGTELEEFITNRPEFWHRLIEKIRERYSGKLTYAANWDEYIRVPFWDELDFIGIDAYFPLSESQHPKPAELEAGWKKWKKEIASLSKEKNRPVLFTEFGYRSMDYTAHKPWLVDRNDQKVNLMAQSTTLESLFKTFWHEPWFAGGYIWKWFIHHGRAGGENDNRFTPQNKPAEKTLKEYYTQYH